MEPRIQYAKTGDGVSIAYWTLGPSGEWVALIPSLGRSGRDFDDLAEALAAAGIRTLTFDPPGIGQSGPPPEGLWIPDQGVAPYRGRG